MLLEQYHEDPETRPEHIHADLGSEFTGLCTVLADSLAMSTTFSAGQAPHQNGTCIIRYNSGGILVSNIDTSGVGTLVRVSTCYGETTRLYEEWIVD